ncbi:MAG TPA: hypothetical protein PK869_12425 [Candidatus Hydrogenedentes bacterium]|nr:hypothetical protein [Candidatus Hydrogenedentota bacterium]
MSTPNLAELVAQQIKSLPSDKQQEVIKSIESIVAEATRIVPQKYTGATWSQDLPSSDADELRPNVWRFTAGTRPTPLP